MDPEPTLQNYLKPATPLHHIIQIEKRVKNNKQADPSQSLNQFANECFAHLSDTYDEYFTQRSFYR